MTCETSGFLLGLLLIWDAFFDRRFEETLGVSLVWALIDVLWVELVNVSSFRASSSPDVSVSGWVASFDDGDTKLCVDEARSDCSVSGTLPFAAIISSFRFSFAQFLAFLKALAPCRKASGLPVIFQPLSWVKITDFGEFERGTWKYRDSESVKT